MKTTSNLFRCVIGLALSAVVVPLRAEQPDAPPRPRDREELRQQLEDLPPEERRARMRELREQWAAQPDTRRPEERRPAVRDFQSGERPQFRGPQPGQPGRFAPMFERVLTEDQRASFRVAMDSQRDKLHDLNDKLREARKEALEASVAEKFKEKDVRKKAIAVAKLEAEIAVFRARALSQVKPTLSAEQIERLKNPPPMDGGIPRPQFQRDEPRRGDRPARGPRDGRDLPPRPGAEQ